MSAASGRGVSNLVVLTRTQAEIEALIQLEQAQSETEFTRTYDEATKLAKAEARAPPKTFATVRLNLAAYAALLFVLFRQKCDLFDKVWTIYGIMKQKDVEATSAGYTPMMCKEIVWSVYDNSRLFFAKRVLPGDFGRAGLAEVPRSLLGAIFQNVRYGERVRRLTFPPTWMEFEKKRDGAEQQQTVTRTTGGGSRGMGGAGRTGGGYAENFGIYERGSGSRQYCPPTGTDFKHVNADIKVALKAFHERFWGRVSITRVLTAAGASIFDMPNWDKFRNDDICWNWVAASGATIANLVRAMWMVQRCRRKWQ